MKTLVNDVQPQHNQQNPTTESGVKICNYEIYMFISS